MKIEDQEWEPRKSMLFCSGKLITFYYVIQENEFLCPPPRPFIVFQTATEDRVISDMAELRRITQDVGCSVTSWVEGHENSFAKILLYLLDDGLLIDSPYFYERYERFGIAITLHFPRLEGHTLRFLYEAETSDISLSWVKIVAVGCDLPSLTLTLTTVCDQPQQKPLGWDKDDDPFPFL